MITCISEIPNAPKAIGPYSPVVCANGFAYLSGQIPINPETGKLIGDGIEEQAEQVMKNIGAVLAHLKVKPANIVKTTIFVTDLTTYQTVNGIYERALGGAKPARSTVQVAALPAGAKIEIEAVVSLT